MRIRKILGRVVKDHVNHSVAKLENNRYAVGRLSVGQTVEVSAQFETLDAAFEHWLATLPIYPNHARQKSRGRINFYDKVTTDGQLEKSRSAFLLQPKQNGA